MDRSLCVCEYMEWRYVYYTLSRALQPGRAGAHRVNTPLPLFILHQKYESAKDTVAHLTCRAPCWSACNLPKINVNAA